MSAIQSILNLLGPTEERKPNDFWAKCPLHQEKTPSFHIREVNGSWQFHCFGCGVSGSANELADLLGAGKLKERVRPSDSPAPTKLEHWKTALGLAGIRTAQTITGTQERRIADLGVEIGNRLSAGNTASAVEAQQVLRGLLNGRVMWPKTAWLEMWDSLEVLQEPKYGVLSHIGQQRRNWRPCLKELGDVPFRTKKLLRTVQSLFEHRRAEVATYLAGRQVGPDLCNHFNLGWSGRSQDDIVTKIVQQGFTIEECMNAGILASSAARGDIRLRWINRLMIPIYDHDKTLVGFSGRAIGGFAAEQVKYLNSPTSTWFQKRQLLYGMDHAFMWGLSEKAVTVVEGYADVWTLHAKKVCSVATMGTAVTPEQIALLTGVVARVHTAFDLDAAGQAASVKIFPSLLQAGVWPMQCKWTIGKDPDEAVRQTGRWAPVKTPLWNLWAYTLLERPVAEQTTGLKTLLLSIGDPFIRQILWADAVRKGLPATDINKQKSIGGLRFRA